VDVELARVQREEHQKVGAMKTVVKWKTSDPDRLIALCVTQDSDLALNYDPGTESVLELPAGHEANAAPNEWHIVGGQLVQKALVTLTATPQRFTADGVAVCAVSHDHSASVDIWVQPGNTVTTVAHGETLDLTSDAPQRFSLRVVNPTLRSRPITVEAV
jgi:hypothetical protein